MNNVVARFADGRVLKGTTVDFLPARDSFHIEDSAFAQVRDRTKVQTAELKALFWVKDLVGDPNRVDKRVSDCTPRPGESAVSVVFRDGEVLVGTTTPYRIEGSGFFLTPADPDSNNTRAFIVKDATQEVRVLC